VKDLCHTKGIAAAVGMTIHKDYRSDRDATIATRLREAGAVLLGKLQLSEGPSVNITPRLISRRAAHPHGVRFGWRSGKPSWSPSYLVKVSFAVCSN
jgi:Asp-tRNA(Asn)/Glu-tRNA(Gln) amidotransferase A subunit family amidase